MTSNVGERFIDEIHSLSIHLGSFFRPLIVRSFSFLVMRLKKVFSALDKRTIRFDEDKQEKYLRNRSYCALLVSIIAVLLVFSLEISVVMRTASTHIKPPRRSSSLVTKITRPILEQQHSTPSGTSVDRTNSSTSSFSSSILTRGMTERLTTPTPPVDKSKSTTHHQRRSIDFSRRKILAMTNTNERQANKENVSSKSTGDPLYRFASTDAKSEQSAQKPAVANHKVTKEYYFHSQPTEDLLNNSYGLTLLQQQQQQPKQIPTALQPRHSVEAVLMISQLPKISSYHQPAQPLTQSLPPPIGPTLESYEDLLCDREVESYFYPVPSSFQSEHIYMNLSTPADPYPSFSPSFDHLRGTLCWRKWKRKWILFLVKFYFVVFCCVVFSLSLCCKYECV